MTTKNMTIAEVATLLNVTTVRVHGLIDTGKLTRSDAPVLKGNKYVTTVTGGSIDKLIADRQARSQTNGTKQYIVSLSEDQLAELSKAGYSLKPRFEKK